MPGRQAASSDLPAPGDLERALGHFLALDLSEIGPALGRLGIGELRSRAEARALEMRE
jgi:hypothetical protein